MPRLTEIKLPLDHADGDLRTAVLARLGIADDELLDLALVRRGYDARRRGRILLVYTLDARTTREAALLAAFARDPHVIPIPDTGYRPVARAPAALPCRPVVVGFGPCGIFAALILAEAGFRPLVLERGKAVRERTQDTWEFWRRRELDPESNVQFGEGGAGTFSDGKLYSGVKDPRFLSRKVFEEFIEAGAPEEIRYVSKPHIGTFKLVSVVEHLRAKIIGLGGEIRFGTRVAGLLLEDGAVRGVQAEGPAGLTEIRTDALVLAVGHSARDTFAMLGRCGVHMDAKPFAVGFRVEHPQSMIDACRFGTQAGHPLLGAADYKLVHHAKNGRAVYSFCMCPGGRVVAATSAPGRVVTNGMSEYSRNEHNANAAIVVNVDPADFPGDARRDPLAGIALQEDLETRAFRLGGENYDAPAQRLDDFLAGRASTRLGEVEPSYKPGVRLADLASALPGYAIDAIRDAMPAFDRQIPGFARPDAVFTGVETRTSSPLRITRDRHSYQSLNTRGLYPAGEGAGYAGGILSAAIDGIEVAEAVALALTGTTRQASATGG